MRIGSLETTIGSGFFFRPNRKSPGRQPRLASVGSLTMIGFCGLPGAPGSGVVMVIGWSGRDNAGFTRGNCGGRAPIAGAGSDACTGALSIGLDWVFSIGLDGVFS